MPILHVRQVPADLLRALRLAARDAGTDLESYVIAALTSYERQRGARQAGAQATNAQSPEQRRASARRAARARWAKATKDMT